MKRLIAIIVLLTMGLSAAAASACPMCKDSIPNSEDTDAALAGTVPSGFNYSVYYMLGGLFLCIGLSTTAIVKGVRSTPVNVPRDPGKTTRA